MDPDETQTVYRDGNGNTDEVDGALVHFRNWNAQQRMRSETIFDGVSLSSTYFLYDIFGDRVLRITSGGVFIHSVSGDFEYDESGSLATKFFFVGGQRVATRATLYTPTPAWQDHWAWHWIGEPAIFIAAPLGVGLMLLGLFGLGAFALSRKPPVWVTAPGVGLLSAGLILLPGSLRAATEAGGGPMPEGQHAEPLLIYLSDHLGSTRVVLDANGIPVETRDYAPFGKEISHTGAFALRNQFTGQPKLSGTELQDYGARLYDARWGRFISPDALVESFDSQGLNRYTYVQNRPTSLVDPEGTQSFSFSFDIAFGNISVFIPLTQPLFDSEEDARWGGALKRLIERLVREGVERLLRDGGQAAGSGVPSGPDVVTGPGAGRPSAQTVEATVTIGLRIFGIIPIPDVEIPVDAGQAREVIDRLEKGALGGEAVPLSDVLSLAGLPADAQQRIDAARGDITFSDVTQSGGITTGRASNLGRPIEERIIGARPPASLAVGRTVGSPVRIGPGQAQLGNLSGLRVRIFGAKLLSVRRIGINVGR